MRQAPRRSRGRGFPVPAGLGAAPGPAASGSGAGARAAVTGEGRGRARAPHGDGAASGAQVPRAGHGQGRGSRPCRVGGGAGAVPGGTGVKRRLPAWARPRGRWGAFRPVRIRGAGEGKALSAGPAPEQGGRAEPVRGGGGARAQGGLCWAMSAESGTGCAIAESRAGRGVRLALEHTGADVGTWQIQAGSSRPGCSSLERRAVWVFWSEAV